MGSNKSYGNVRNGNTLRLKKSRFHRQYAGSSWISCSVSNVSLEEPNIENTKFLNDTDILYSLNKKGRWNLPDLIKEELVCSLVKSPCKVSLLEVHKLDRINNCVGYFTNKGRTKRVVPTKTKYINRKSVVNVNKKPHKRHNLRVYRTGQGNIIEPEPAEPTVEYQVVYPGSIESSVTLANPKSVAGNIHMKRDPWNQSSISRKTPRRTKHHRIPDVIDDDEINEEFLQTVCEADDSPVEECHLDTKPDLGEYVQNALFNKISKSGQRQRIKRSHKRNIHRRTNEENRCDLIKKLHEEYLTLHGDSFEETPSVDIYGSVTRSQNATKPVPVDVILPKQDVETNNLINNIPFPISFADCLPRKFIVDTSEKLYECLKSTTAFRKVTLQKFELTCYIVFTFKKNYDGNNDVYSVHLNIATKMRTIGIETLFHMMPSNITDILNRCFMFFETFHPDTLLQKDVMDLAKKPTLQLETLRPFLQLKTNSFLPDSLSEAESSEFVDGFEWIITDEEELCCNVCFETISERPCTALRSCGHWFCDECWHEHIINSVTATQLKCRCPEYDCDKEVDTWSMVTLLNVFDIKRSQNMKMSNIVDTSSNHKWCPNQNCGRVLHNVDSSVADGFTVLCRCGLEICFKCTREGHWPASCQQFRAYSNKLNAFGDDILCTNNKKYLPVKVRGKHCPKCNRFIEKNGGCPSMVCVCGLNFCWHCLKPYSQHRTMCQGTNFMKGTELKYIHHIERKVEGDPCPTRTTYYLLAVENRRHRHPREIKVFTNKAMKLKSRMKTWIRKHDLSELGFLLDNNAIDELFNSLVNLKIELNYLSEFCFVLLDGDKNKPSNVRFSAFYMCSLSRDLQELLSRDNIDRPKALLVSLLKLREKAKSQILAVVSKFKH